MYLLPAVVGGGLGDVEEVLAAGRRLARDGARLYLYRRPGRSLPRSVDGPWAWPRLRRVARLTPTAPVALTVVPAWGISAAPAGPPPLGRPGPWAEEAADIEAAYGADRTLHISLEEFARTLPLADEERERFREGGTPARALRARVAAARRAGDGATFAAAFRRFRAFDRPNVLHLFATFERNPRFARAFREAVQTGPLGPASDPRPGARRRRSRTWVWYASPASAERLYPWVVRALAAARPPVRLWVRSPRPWRTGPRSRGVTISTAPVAAGRWQRAFRAAPVRIVTGSRTLLEALAAGGPFLYFNGILGTGAGQRRHRPEKIVALLRAARAARWPADARRDLADFARGRRVGAVVARAAAGVGGWGRRWPRIVPRGFDPPFDDAGSLLVALARALAVPGARATEIVARVRAGSSP